MLLDADSTGSHSPDLQAQSQIQTIINEPGFCLQTALLWIRTGTLSSSLEDIKKPDSNGKTGAKSLSSTSRSQMPGNTKTTAPELGLLSLHLDRILAAADAIGWYEIKRLLSPRDTGINLLYTAIQNHIDTLPNLTQGTIQSLKVRLTIDRAGQIDAQSTAIDNTCTPFIPTSLAITHPQPYADVYLDTRATQPSVFTGHKTTHRPFYDGARQRAQIIHCPPTEAEVLLHNAAQEVMEASLCTVYLLRGGRWITPATRCGGNVGVSRRLALESGICEEGVVHVKSLEVGEHLWLSNAARGFFLGRIVSDLGGEGSEDGRC